LKLISGYRDSEIGWISFVILGMVVILCFTLLFCFLCDFGKCYLLIWYCLEFWIEFGWALCVFRQAGLDLAIEVILQVYLRRVEYPKSCWRDSKQPSY